VSASLLKCAYCPFTDREEDAMLDHVLASHPGASKEEDWDEVS